MLPCAPQTTSGQQTPTLTINKVTVAPTNVTLGAEATFTITVVNEGLTVVANDVVMRDTFPAGLTPIAGSVSVSGGSGGATGPRALS